MDNQRQSKGNLAKKEIQGTKNKAESKRNWPLSLNMSYFKKERRKSF